MGSAPNQALSGTVLYGWWLRSPGNNQNNAADVYSGGSLSFDFVYDGGICVRPALWVNIEMFPQ